MAWLYRKLMKIYGFAMPSRRGFPAFMPPRRPAEDTAAQNSGILFPALRLLQDFQRPL
jgi:hypothetical protein